VSSKCFRISQEVDQVKEETKPKLYQTTSNIYCIGKKNIYQLEQTCGTLPAIFGSFLAQFTCTRVQVYLWPGGSWRAYLWLISPTGAFSPLQPAGLNHATQHHLVSKEMSAMWWMQFDVLLSYDGTVRAQTSGELAQLVGLSGVCLMK